MASAMSMSAMSNPLFAVGLVAEQRPVGPHHR